MKSPFVCLLILSIALIACAQTPKDPIAAQEVAAKSQPAPTPAPIAPAAKPASYPVPTEQQQQLIALANAEQQTIGELLNAEQALRAAPIKRQALQPLLKEKANLDAKQIVQVVNALLATSQWQEADAAKQQASKNVLNWINENRPKDCPECQLAPDGKQWLRQ